RFPSIFEGFSNINSGGVKRVGGLKVMSNGVFENAWLKNSIDAFTAAVNTDVNTQGLSQSAAIEKNKGLLQRNTYTYLQPEQMHSFEVGYRSILFNKRFFIDADLYYNFYSNFIAQIEASIPNTTDSAQIPASLYDRNKQGRYRLWTNSKTIVHNYGAEIDLLYLINNRYSLWGNASYQTLKRTSTNDGLEDGFNTPKWMVNAGIRGSNVYKKLGFNITAKYQSNFYWKSFLINGNVPAIFNADAMLQYAFTNPSLNIKVGATNILNHYYYSMLGGPQIGGFYYTTLTYSW
ncbi:MAG TPA: TonB-dependent receptor, partial [Niastella sp.]